VESTSHVRCGKVWRGVLNTSKNKNGGFRAMSPDLLVFVMIFLDPRYADEDTIRRPIDVELYP